VASHRTGAGRRGGKGRPKGEGERREKFVSKMIFFLPKKAIYSLIPDQI